LKDHTHRKMERWRSHRSLRVEAAREVALASQGASQASSSLAYRAAYLKTVISQKSRFYWDNLDSGYFTLESGHVLAKRFDKLSKLNRFLRAGAVPVLSIPLALWCTGACIRQTCQPRTAGARQGFPVRFDFALHRGAAWALCMGLMIISLSCLPLPARLCFASPPR
jgi:hypothetical protein